MGIEQLYIRLYDNTRYWEENIHICTFYFELKESRAAILSVSGRKESPSTVDGLIGERKKKDILRVRLRSESALNGAKGMAESGTYHQ